MPHNFACRVQAVNLLVANSLEYETYHWQPCARFVNPNIRYLVIYLYLGQGMPYDLILSSEKSADDPHLPSDNTTVSPTEPSFLAKMRASAIDKKISEGDSRETLRDKEYQLPVMTCMTCKPLITVPGAPKTPLANSANGTFGDMELYVTIELNAILRASSAVIPPMLENANAPLSGIVMLA